MNGISIIIYIVAALVVGIVTLQLTNFSQWLVWACSEAENALGGGTGKLKLKYVYNLAVTKFPILAKILPYGIFSKLVDKALVKMRDMIVGNDKIDQIINGVSEVTEEAKIIK